MEEVSELKKEEVVEFIDYTAELFSQLKNGTYLPFYDSQIENQNLVDLNNNPQIPTQESIRGAIANYKTNSDRLSNYNEFMNMWDGIFSKVITHYSSLLAFNWHPYCINAKKEDYGSEEYEKDLNRVFKFFNNFNHKKEFKVAFKNMLKNDTYYCWLRDSSGTFRKDDNSMSVKKDNKYSLQTMPQKWCKITGKHYSGFLWDFNFNYFQNSGVNITDYDPSISRLYNSEVEKNHIKSYITNRKDLNQTNGYSGYAYTRVNPEDGAWCFKFDESNFNTIPPFTYLLKSVFDNDVIEKMQKNKDIISSYAIILGEIKTKKDENASSSKSPFVISPKDLANLMKLAKKGIDSSVKQIALPTEDNKLFQFADNNSNMLNNKLSSTAGLGASASSMIYSTGSMAQFEMESALNEDYQFVSKIYKQFEDFLNFFVNKKTKKFKFRFVLSGSTIPSFIDSEINRFEKLSAKGIQVSIHKWASLYGLEPQELKSMMEEMQHSNISDELMLLLNTNTKDDGSYQDTGRPSTDSESANKTKDYL